MSKKSQFEEIKKQVTNLSSSPLFNYRKKNNYKPVVGEGSLNAKVMFIGEAPGKNEAEQGKPFVGSAGKYLDTLLKKAGLKRSDVYITSVLFDRPPKNRNPKPNEIEIYKPYLIRLIELIEPEYIVTLGTFATKTVIKNLDTPNKFTSIGKNHGKVVQAKTNSKKIKIVPSYHPAAVFYNRGLQEKIENDFAKLGELVK